VLRIYNHVLLIDKPGLLRTATFGVLSALCAACSSPTSPSVAANSHQLAISSISSVGSRRNQPSGFADAGEMLTLNATVSGHAGADVTYLWSGPGTFNGSGAIVSWTAPASTPTPSTIDLTLVASERYDEGGTTHASAARSTFPVHVHDSGKEILDMGEEFLSLFSRNAVPTNAVLHNFSASCDGGTGRDNEAGDTDKARARYRQDFSKFRVRRLPPVTYNFGGACLVFGSRFRHADACSLLEVHWEFTYLVDEDGHKAGDHGVTDGVDSVTAVLENGEWRLCASDFQGR
jgi:hypothetical protein